MIVISRQKDRKISDAATEIARRAIAQKRPLTRIAAKKPKVGAVVAIVGRFERENTAAGIWPIQKRGHAAFNINAAQGECRQRRDIKMAIISLANRNPLKEHQYRALIKTANLQFTPRFGAFLNID